MAVVFPSTRRWLRKPLGGRSARKGYEKMSIPFTQYLMPDGRQKEVTIDMPANVEQAARALIEKGCHFDIEMLSTGLISMTCEKGDDLISMEVCPNDERVVAGVEKIVKVAAAQQGVHWTIGGRGQSGR